jgi:hypothetical protein
MQLRLPPGMDMLSYFITELTREAKRLLYNEFGYIFNNTDTQVIIETIDDPMLIYEDCIKNEPYLTKDLIFNNIKIFENRYCSTSMYVTHDEYYYSNIFVLKQIKLVMYKPGLSKMIIHYMHNLSLLLEYMKYSVRHEVGHMIELMSCRGKTLDEMNVRRDTINNAQKSHFAKWNDLMHHDCIDRMYEYYAMPQERLANEYAHVDLEKLIEYNRKLCDEVDGDVYININGSVTHRQRPIQQTVYGRKEEPAAVAYSAQPQRIITYQHTPCQLRYNYR